MQIKVSIKPDTPCVLPIAYHHILQSAIYSLIGGELHDVDFKYDKRGYKLFVFGPIEGRYSIKNKTITFQDEMSFEVRCLFDEIGLSIIRNVLNKGIRLGAYTYSDVEACASNHIISNNNIRIIMKSPICVYETDDDRHTYYHNPGEEEFYSLVEDNFVRKYAAVAGEYPINTIELSPLQIRDKDRYITKYKGIYIEAWKGVYELTGEQENLNFLYNTGLGSKNSQGFGLFDIID